MILENLEMAKFIKRYKRFLVDVRDDVGVVKTVHCPNTGSMRTCLEPGGKVLLSTADNPKRKYPQSLEMTQIPFSWGNDDQKTWVGINTIRTNHLVREAIEEGVITELGVPDSLQAEVKVSGKSRLDFLAIKDGIKTYIEVKNCTLAEDGVAKFPDAVTARGTKHLQELMAIVAKGDRAMIFFCIQREDCQVFQVAGEIDPVYAETLAAARDLGVEVVAYRALLSPSEIVIKTKVDIQWK